jgi:serine/threonine-protein kinase
MSLRIGEIFAGYRILRLLGSGGMGEVYLVQHPRLPRRDALKVLRPDISSDASFRERFIREADLAAGLRHPHIVGVQDRGEHDGRMWIAMDYIEGTDSAQLLQQRYPAGMPTELATTVVTGVASALDYAHKKGLLHRDVKPANVIVADIDTEDPQVFLADFGIARPLDDTGGVTTTNMTVGTVAYSSPEQLMGEQLDGRSDQYALAATAYHLLSGLQLFPHSNAAVVISKHLNTTPPPLADTRPDCAALDAVLQIALAKNPDDRFSSCSEFAQALVDESPGNAAASARAATQVAPRSGRASPKAARTGPGPTVARSPRRAGIIAGSVAVALVVIAVIVTWRPWNSQLSNSAATTSTPAATAAVPPPRPSNPVGEAHFLADVHAKIPTADIPGGRPTDTRLVAYGYQACSVMDQYPNPASAAAPFYEAVAREAGHTRDSATISSTNAANELWFMTIAAQYLCGATASSSPMTALSPASTATSPPTPEPTPVPGLVQDAADPCLSCDAPDVKFFHSPSNNIQCEIDYRRGSGTTDSVYCLSIDPPRNATMSSSGVLTSVCTAGDSCLSNPPQGEPTLPYGHTTGIGPFTCLSEYEGMRCTVTSGRGFTMSKSGITPVG